MTTETNAGKPLLQIVAVLLVLLIASCDRGVIVHRSQPIVFVLAGQSNMVGQGRMEDLTAEQKAIPSNVRFFVGSEEASLAQQSSFGPEITFAEELAKLTPNRDFVLVKYAIGATSLLDWAPDWDATRAEITGNAERGPLYRQLIQIIEELPIGNAEFGGVLWMQGERDARIAEAGKDYYQNLKDLIVAFRIDLSRPDLPFVLGSSESTSAAVSSS